MEERVYTHSHTFTKVEEIINAFSIFGNYRRLGYNYIFRGHKDIKYQLIPSVLRKENHESNWQLSTSGKPYDNQSEWEMYQIDLEYNIIKQFFDIADKSGLYIPEVKRIREYIHDFFNSEIRFKSEEWLPDEFLEIAGLAQHYGLPTRLLDWTYDYKVALYFLASGLFDDNTKQSDGVLWALNHTYFEFLKPTVKKSPLHFIRPAYHGNPFLSAQRGLFSIWKINKIGGIELSKNNDYYNLIDRQPLDEKIVNFIDSIEEDHQYLEQEKILYKFTIPHNLKPDILWYLYNDGYSEEYLFPGYHGCVLAIKNSSLLKKFQ
ncbi:MAG: hypothetical protein A2086_08945 [Spirochaetes bacterium GWD1_27_9]|nr:MAG: hypothetical protein A2Z98_13365 [Spirochaetes bacterium GWB1_27_13]OHD20908.1 MAG: hypothetical protein A2Y34_11785 [Spirochaetes bacterium GWC1_27_15]OHD44706.1 MAG: hypothetical protein A2086_08945 [Spirochaetes bacterium GWD1_27_9]